MSKYTMNFGTFELGGATLVDRTTHVLEVAHPGHENVALIVFREPIPDGETLGDLVARRIADEMVRLRGYAVLAKAEVAWGGGTAHDIASRWINEGRAIYGRQAHLAIDRTWVVFAMSAPYPSREACDGWFDEIMGSFTPAGPA
jgi:hypothetical protein